MPIDFHPQFSRWLARCAVDIITWFLRAKKCDGPTDGQSTDTENFSILVIWLITNLRTDPSTGSSWRSTFSPTRTSHSSARCARRPFARSRTKNCTWNDTATIVTTNADCATILVSTLPTSNDTSNEDTHAPASTSVSTVELYSERRLLWRCVPWKNDWYPVF